MNQKPHYINPDFNPSFSLHLLRTVCKLAALQGLASVHLCHQPDHTIPATHICVTCWLVVILRETPLVAGHGLLSESAQPKAPPSDFASLLERLL